LLVNSGGQRSIAASKINGLGSAPPPRSAFENAYTELIVNAFRGHPERFHRCRLATPTEIEDLREHGCFDGGGRLADDCFIYALSRINRESGDLHRLFVVLRAGTGMDEGRCSAAWFQSEVITGQIERLGQ